MHQTIYIHLHLTAGAVAPKFADSEGLYLYNPNINLVLGNLYQPLILGSDGKTLVLKLLELQINQKYINRFILITLVLTRLTKVLRVTFIHVLTLRIVVLRLVPYIVLIMEKPC